MANMRNKWEFYGSILEALGVDYTDAELKNNETLRAKLLEGLGVEHTYDDVNQYPLWREKLVEGVGNMSGGGGSSDFSTAEVTFVNSTRSFKQVGNIINIVDDAEEPYMRAEIISVIGNGTTVVNAAVLYKGFQYVPVVSGTTITNTTGDVEVIETPDETGLLIKGGCTITIS